MAKIKGNSKYANKTSYPNQKGRDVPPKVVLKKFNEIRKNAEEDENILSWQAACMSIGWRVTKCDYWAEKLPVFGCLKREVMQLIILRINNGALKGNFVPAPAIWRMKQSGEKDEQTVNNNNKSVNPTQIIVQDQETADELNKLKEKE